MTIKEYSPDKRPTLDLAGEEGNVFHLMAIALNVSKQLELDGKAIINEMKASDYGNAVYVFNREFGDFYDIILPPGMTVKSLEDSYLKTNNTPEKIKSVYLK